MDEINTANQTTGRRRPLRLAAVALSSVAAIAVVAGMNNVPLPAKVAPEMVSGTPLAGEEKSLQHQYRNRRQLDRVRR